MLAMQPFRMMKSEKVLFVVWILLGIIIATAYKSTLKAMLTTQTLKIPFKTIDEMIENTDYNIQLTFGSVLVKSAKVKFFML